MSDVYIYRATGSGYIPRVRMRGQRRWTCLGKKRAQIGTAINVMSKAMNSRKWDYGDVILVADWYEPRAVFEAKFV